MSKRNYRKVMASASIPETHFLFAFIRPVDPSGLPFEDIRVSIAIATGKPYQQSFFCTSPSFPPAPIASTPKPISFEELHKLALCELENINCIVKKLENENRADQAKRYKEDAQKLEKIAGTKESEWRDLLNL